VSKLGGALDHGSDFVFVSVGLLALAWRGAIPWLLPPLVAIAFAQYVIDSLWIDRRPELRMSAIGRYNGIFYFVPAGVDIGVRLGLAVLARPNRWLGWLLVATTLISIGDRLLARSSRLSGAPDSPDAGRRDRSSR
jgi:phosphatidylglycerophosphate synthase